MRLRGLITAASMLCVIGIASNDRVYAQYQKMVFVEDFSSVTCVNCPQAAAIVSKIANENRDRVLTTQWHLDIPGRNDPFYAANKPHNDARDDYYGPFGALPQVFVNGRPSVGTNEATVRADVNAELSEESPIRITVTHERVGNTVNVRVSVETEEGLPNGYRLFAVAVEGMVHRPREYFVEVVKSQPYYEETEFRDLFRTFVTSPNGVEVTIGSDETKHYNYTYTIKDDWAPGEMYVIAWVQDEFTHEIVQAGSSPKPPSLGVVEETALAGYSLGLVSPNPAGSEALVTFSLGAPEEAALTLHTMNGEKADEISLGRLESGDHTAKISTSDLPAGAYTLTLHAGQFRASQKLTVIR